jgi:predicted nucleic-acid-binding protein
MKALDTNVLVRFLVKDDPVQSQKVYQILKNAESDRNCLWVPLLVVLETIWVLEAVYEIPRKEIINSLTELLLMPVLKFEGQTAVQKFILSARNNTIDLSDIMIACSAVVSGSERVLTFDKKASKMELFELI